MLWQDAVLTRNEHYQNPMRLGTDQPHALTKPDSGRGSSYAYSPTIRPFQQPAGYRPGGKNQFVIFICQADSRRASGTSTGKVAE